MNADFSGISHGESGFSHPAAATLDLTVSAFSIALGPNYA